MAVSTVEALLKGRAPLGTEVTVEGWVRSRRDSKAGMSFLAVHDGSHLQAIQAVAPASLPNYQAEVLALGAGCAVRVSGALQESQGQGQAVEIQAASVEPLGWVQAPETYPIAKKRHTFEYLRTVAHLRPRTNTFGAMARVRTSLAAALHGYLQARGFHWVNTPLITASDCEGAGQLFRVAGADGKDFFGQETFLTVSGQLNLEAYCLALSRVYAFGPTFRAENSNTARHLAEFWMLEPEVAFADLDDNAALAEDLLKQTLQRLLDEREDDLAFFQERIDKGLLQRLAAIIDQPFERLEYSDAIRMLQASGEQFEFPVDWGLDLQTEHERYLTEKHVGRPVVVVNYPADIKAFYMRLNDDGRTVAAMDVLAPGIGELIGGSQREERLEALEARIPDQAMKDALWWYLDLRRYGSVPHAGFGLGFERLLNYVTGMENIRDAIPFPRTPGNASF